MHGHYSLKVSGNKLAWHRVDGRERHLDGLLCTPGNNITGIPIQGMKNPDELHNPWLKLK